ncbi:hypothetical protein K7432_004205 [Basidiobolus ranarum]|uniref:DUF7137 domain-containing protein n=1 Tax=Basidiobolus ranarum TaxID=34480 RepID=A0ABR2WYN9_9FUNG
MSFGLPQYFMIMIAYRVVLILATLGSFVFSQGSFEAPQSSTFNISKLVSPKKVQEGLALLNFTKSLGYDDKIRQFVHGLNLTEIRLKGNGTYNGTEVSLSGSKIYVNSKEVLINGTHTIYGGDNITVKDGYTIVNGTSLLVKGDHVFINGTDVQYQSGRVIVNGTNIQMCTNRTSLYNSYGRIYGPNDSVLNCNEIIAWGNGTIGEIVTPQSPVGEIRMTNPPVPNLLFPYFEIGAEIEFKWYLGDVVYKPQQLNLVIERSDIMYSYVVSYNMSGNTTHYVWKTSQVNQTDYPLLTSSDYVLKIFDERGEKALPIPGKLAPFSARFGMYISTSFQGKLTYFALIVIPCLFV